MPKQGKPLDLTEHGVQFAKWDTGVEDDHLTLQTLNLSEDRKLTAVFSSYEKQAQIAFVFEQADAFRVLDEGGLLELWAASRETPRPALSTFRIRGHMWQAESPLAWIHGADEDYFSYMIATDWDCLEVISLSPPRITITQHAN